MLKKNWSKLFLVLIISVSLWSCEEDFIETGSGLINTIQLPPLYQTDNIVAYTKRVSRVQTNNLNVHTLADFQDPIYGRFQSSLLTQLHLSVSNNDFGTDPILDSVTLTLPFFSRDIGENQFVLDSVDGDGAFFLKIFKSNHLLREIDPGEDGDFSENQVYFSDQFSTFQPNIETESIAEIGPLKLEDFNEGIELIQRSGPDIIDTLNVSPRIRVSLPVPLFEELIFDKIGEPELVSNANFVNYFRGIHVVMESTSNDGVYAAFNLLLEDANITLHYQTQRPKPVLEIDEEVELETVYNRFRLTFEGVKVSLFEDDFTINASSPDTVDGDENLFIKGGAGYYSEIELFTGLDSNDDGVSDELQDLRDRRILVNEANLEFFVNEDLATSSTNFVNRIILFNIEDNAILVDYELDRTADDNPNSSRISHLGPLTNLTDQGRIYRIRITDHINTVVNLDSTNVKLGLMVTENVNATAQIQAESESVEDEIDRIFRSTVQFTKGTVLHGSNSPNEEKRIKMRLQVTEIN